MLFKRDTKSLRKRHNLLGADVRRLMTTKKRLSDRLRKLEISRQELLADKAEHDEVR